MITSRQLGKAKEVLPQYKDQIESSDFTWLTKDAPLYRGRVSAATLCEVFAEAGIAPFEKVSPKFRKSLALTAQELVYGYPYKQDPTAEELTFAKAIGLKIYVLSDCKATPDNSPMYIFVRDQANLSWMIEHTAPSNYREEDFLEI